MSISKSDLPHVTGYNLAAVFSWLNMSVVKSQIGFQLIILLAAVNALIAAAIDMYLPAFPAVAADLQISDGQVQQTLTIFLIGLAIGQGIYGPLLDRYGRRTPLLVGVALFTLGSLLAAVSQSFSLLLLARLLQAIGAAAGSVTPRAVIADCCDVNTAARAFSMLMQVMMIAPITAPMIGGAVLLLGSWQLIFWILALCGLFAGVFVWWLLPETLPQENRTPISARAIASNYLKLLAHPRYLLFTLASGCTVGLLFTYISNSPFIFIEHFQLSPAAYSFVFGASAGGMIITSQINLRLLRYFKPLQVLHMGLLAMVVLVAVLGALVWAELVNLWSYAILLGMAVAMLGMISGNLTAVTMGYAGNFAGIASSLMGMMQFFLAGSIGFIINLTPTSLATLPLALLVFGLLAIGLCVLANRAPLPN